MTVVEQDNLAVTEPLDLPDLLETKLVMVLLVKLVPLDVPVFLDEMGTLAVLGQEETPVPVDLMETPVAPVPLESPDLVEILVEA